jgi:hypothetical protein
MRNFPLLIISTDALATPILIFLDTLPAMLTVHITCTLFLAGGVMVFDLLHGSEPNLLSESPRGLDLLMLNDLVRYTHGTKSLPKPR